MKNVYTSFFEILVSIALLVIVVFALLEFFSISKDQPLQVGVQGEQLLQSSTSALSSSSGSLFHELLQEHGISTGYIVTNEHVYYVSSETVEELQVNKETFTILTELNTDWAKDDSTVYLSGKPVHELDAESFTVSSDYYVTDAHGVYIRRRNGIQLLPLADPLTFAAITGSSTYFKDANHVWYKDGDSFTDIHSSHIESFRLIEEPYYTNTVSIFAFGKTIPEIRTSKFSLIGSIQTDTCSNYFTKDHKNVYQTTKDGTSILQFASPHFFVLESYGSDTTFFSAKDQDTVFMGTCALQKIRGLQNLATAHIIHDSVVQDAGGVYKVNNGKALPVPGINGVNFKHIENEYYSDGAYMYYGSNLERLSEAPLATSTFATPYLFNTTAVYCDGKKMKSINPASFTSMQYGYATDGKHIYARCEPLSIIADIESFAFINETRGMDSAHLYSFDPASKEVFIVEIADLESYEILDKNFSRDTSNVYFTPDDSFELFTVTGADPFTFVASNKGFGIDSAGTYDASSPMLPVQLSSAT